MKLSFSLKSKPAAGPTPPLKPATPFISLEDDPADTNAAAATATATAATSTSSASASASGSASGSASALSPTTTTAGRASDIHKHLVAQNTSTTSRAIRKKLEEQKKLDQTIFQYDEVYDVMEQAKQRSKEKRELETLERKPKYIGSLLESAATRRLDYLRAEEKLIQREREQEGDEFMDKEQFVTQAYKDQMAEVRRAEAEEKQREEMIKAKKAQPTGMAHFYRQLLERSEEEHSATVAATTQAAHPIIGPQGPNLTITKPVGFASKSDVELARAARAEGKDVELNDDNQIVDKRELLSAGLNLAAPNTRHLGGLRTAARTKPLGGEAKQEVQVHRATGAAASRREINERRARELERQIAEEQERLVQQKEREELEERERIVAKRNDEEAIENARTRYLERKRRKLEDGTAVPTGEVA